MTRHIYTADDAERAWVEEAERRHATAVRQLGEALVEAATLRRQRDEAVKAFQRERARVVDLRQKLASAAIIVDKHGDMLDHLVMDTPEDQELHAKVVQSFRESAAALREAADR